MWKKWFLFLATWKLVVCSSVDKTGMVGRFSFVHVPFTYCPWTSRNGQNATSFGTYSLSFTPCPLQTCLVVFIGFDVEGLGLGLEVEWLDMLVKYSWRFKVLGLVDAHFFVQSNLGHLIHNDVKLTIFFPLRNWITLTRGWLGLHWSGNIMCATSWHHFIFARERFQNPPLVNFLWRT